MCVSVFLSLWRRLSHRPRRFLSWGLLALGLGAYLVGCGSQITFIGPECVNDLSLLEREGADRLGCLVFSHDNVARAVVYRPDGPYWKMLYCENLARQSCTIAETPVKFGKVKGADEVAVVAFPPISTTTNFQSAKEFLSFCAGRFDPERPTIPVCQNDGSQTSVDQVVNCWFVFHFKYNRETNSGQCTRWQQ